MPMSHKRTLGLCKLYVLIQPQSWCPENEPDTSVKAWSSGKHVCEINTTYNPILCSKLRLVYRCIQLFPMFDPKTNNAGTRYLGEAVLMCTHNQCFEQNKENIKKSQLNSFHFYNRKNAVYCMGMFP